MRSIEVKLEKPPKDYQPPAVGQRIDVTMDADDRYLFRGRVRGIFVDGPRITIEVEAELVE